MYDWNELNRELRDKATLYFDKIDFDRLEEMSEEERRDVTINSVDVDFDCDGKAMNFYIDTEVGYVHFSVPTDGQIEGMFIERAIKKLNKLKTVWEGLK